MTMLLVIISTSAIYLAADSKQFPSGLATQKLFKVGPDAALLDTGIALIPGNTEALWNAEFELGMITKTPPQGDFEEQLRSIRSQLGNDLQRALNLSEVALPSNASFSFFFAKHGASASHVVFQNITIKVDDARRTIVIDEPKSLEPGIYWSVAPGCGTPNVNGMKLGGTSLKQLQIIFGEVAARSKNCTAQIGPPIRAAVIDDAGFRELKD